MGRKTLARRGPRMPTAKQAEKLRARANEIIVRNLAMPIVPDDQALLMPKRLRDQRGLMYGPDLGLIVLIHQQRAEIGVTDAAGQMLWEITLSSPMKFDPEMCYDAAHLFLKEEELDKCNLDGTFFQGVYMVKLITPYLPEGREELYLEALTKWIPDDHTSDWTPPGRDDYEAKPTIVLSSK